MNQPTSGSGESPLPFRFGWALALLLALDALVVLVPLGRSSLWNIDEGRIAEVAREMAVSGDWVTPRIGNELFSCYPPLPYWLLAVSGKIFGFNEFAMRLPSALAGLALVAVTALLGRRIAGERAGLASGMILATIPGFTLQETTCRADVITLCFATLAFDRFAAWAEGERRLRDLLLTYVWVSLGVLSKGPIAIALLGLGGLSWFLLRRRWSLLLRMKWWLGLPISAAIILPWFVLAARASGSFILEDILLNENLRAYSDGYQQKRSIVFYLYAIPYLTVPWLLTLAYSWNVRRSRGLDLALAWTAGVLLFLMISSAKRISYVCYVCVPLALAAGITLTAVPAGTLKKGLLWMATAIGLVALALLAIPAGTWKGDRVAAMVPLILPAAILLGVGALGLGFCTWKRGALEGATALAAFLALGTFLNGWIVEPRLDEGRDGIAFARRVAARSAELGPIYTLNTENTEGYFHFYAGMTMPMRSPGPGCYVLSEPARESLLAEGRKTEILDQVQFKRGRYKYLLRIAP